jgi:hypothetical protein
MESPEIRIRIQVTSLQASEELNSVRFAMRVYLTLSLPVDAFFVT